MKKNDFFIVHLWFQIESSGKLEVIYKLDYNLVKNI